MGIDVATEETLGLREAAERLPPGRGGRPVTVSCLTRWIIAGIKTPGREPVRLEAVRVGGRWVTTAGALRRFSAALTANAIGGRQS